MLEQLGSECACEVVDSAILRHVQIQVGHLRRYFSVFIVQYVSWLNEELKTRGETGQYVLSYTSQWTGTEFSHSQLSLKCQTHQD